MINPASSPQKLALLNNRYRVLKVLGEGGFGTTFLAEDIQMPSLRKCVVKQLKPVSDKPEIYQLVKERFQREATILEQLGESHDQIPKLYAYFAEEEQFYLVEEWVEGETLTQMLQKNGPLTESTVQKLLISLLPVLDYIHKKQIVHRDIKPDNIILRQRDEQPVLIDFGAVKETMGTVINSQGQSSRSIVIGTPGFMSSEQSAGRPIYASDLYSLGLTAIYLLTGKTPQELDTDPQTGMILWRSYVPNINSHFADVLDQAIHLNLGDRFGNAQQMLSALTGVAATISVPPGVAVSPPPAAGGMAGVVSSQPAAGGVAGVVPSQPASGGVAGVASAQSAAGGVVGVAGPDSTQPTQYIAPPPQEQTSTSAAKGEWKTAALTGTVIGAFILLGAFVIRAELPKIFNTADKTPETTPSPSKTVGAADPVQPPPTPQPVAPPPPQATPAPASSVPTNATVAGKPGSKNVRSGPGTGYGVVTTTYPGDRIQVIGGKYNSDNYLWYQVYIPNSGTQGWLASHLTDLDAQASVSIARPPVQKPKVPQLNPPKVQQKGTNATIVGKPGSKNIRRGPGTDYGVQHIAYPGDRVRILSSSQDRGGYTWHKVYFPKSGASGWIAGQLIKVD